MSSPSDGSVVRYWAQEPKESHLDTNPTQASLHPTRSATAVFVGYLLTPAAMPGTSETPTRAFLF